MSIQFSMQQRKFYETKGWRCDTKHILFGFVNLFSKIKLISLSFLCLSFFLSACGSNGGGAADNGPETVSEAPSVSPPSLNLSVDREQITVANSATVTSANGVAPWTWSVLSGPATINSSGLVTPTGAPGTVVISGTDSMGTTGTTDIEVFAALSGQASDVFLTYGESASITSVGGVPPVTASVLSGPVSLSGNTITAQSVSGNATLRFEDALGNLSDVSVEVREPVSLSISTSEMSTNSSQNLTASGGYPPYTFSIISGQGTVDPSSGLFTAPSVPGVSLVRATDSQGHASSSQTINVYGSPLISPLSLSVAVGNSATFSASGGLPPYSYSLVSGTGSVGSTTGSYIAGLSAGTEIVRVTDSLGGTSEAIITVNPALSLTPLNGTVLINQSMSFTASGGVEPRTFSLVSGSGSINSSTGVYTAPSAPGSAQIRVQDSYGNSVVTNIAIVDAVTIQPLSTTLAVNNSYTFSASGGQAPYVYSIFSGGGAIDASTGNFTAPPVAGTVVVRVTDQLSTTSDATVVVNPALSMSPSNDFVIVNGTKNFSSAGGVPPYTYSVILGTGSINSATGVYTAPSAAEASQVQVQDSLGNTSSTNLNVVEPLVISPSSLTLAVNNQQTFTSTGGATPYSYSIDSGGGTINSATGVYTAPGVTSVTVVRVTDSFGQTSSASVTINGPLALSPLASFVVTNQNLTFSATGGVPPFVFSLTSGDGSINSSTGVYTAPTTPGAVGIRVTDSMANQVDTTLTVVEPLNLTAPSSTLLQDDQITFVGSGGQAPLVYSIVSGGGIIDSATGEYTAPSVSGTVIVRVTDAFNQTANFILEIYGPLEITPTTLTLAPTNTYDFNSSGGYGAITFSIFSGSGSIDPASGEFVAGMIAETVIIRATDSLGSTADATVTVNGALSLSPLTFKMSMNSQRSFVATNGVPPYTFSIEDGGGSIDSSTGAYTAPSFSDTVVIRVTDSLNNFVESNVTVVTPAKIVSGGLNNCVIFDDGSLKCWGDGARGQLGSGGTADRGGAANQMGSNLAFLNLGTGVMVSELSIGYLFMCALTTDSRVKCWGTAANGIQGNASTTAHRGDGPNEMGDNLPFMDFGAGRTVKKLRAGASHACVILDNDALKCWGLNNYGQLGIGDALTRGDGANEMGDNLPAVQLGTGLFAVDVALSTVSTCALLNTGQVKCWGRNHRGQLGQGNVTTRGTSAAHMGDSLAFTPLGTGKTALQIVGGNLHFCALLNDNGVKCWGAATNGSLGNASTTNHRGDAANEMGDNLAYVNLGTGLTVNHLSTDSRSYTNCAELNTGEVKCWGRNTSGALGQQHALPAIGDAAGEMGDSLVATQLGSSFVLDQISSGQDHSCVLSDDKTVKCWGVATNGIQGNGSTSAHRGDAANEMGDNNPFIDL